MKKGSVGLSPAYRERMRLRKEGDEPNTPDPTSDRVVLQALFSPSTQVALGGGGAREALHEYTAFARGFSGMPLYLIAPARVGAALAVTNVERVRSDFFGVPAEGFPRPPSRECFIAWGEPITVEVTDPAATVAMWVALGQPPRTPDSAKGIRLRVGGVYVFEPEEDGEQWMASLFVHEDRMGPSGRWEETFTFPLDLAISDGSHVHFQHPGARRLLYAALDACSSYQRARQEVSKKHRRRMKKQGQLPPSEFYLVSQQPLRQHKPHQGGTHASPSFEYDVRGHWAFRTKRVQGGLTGKERERWTRKNTDRRQYQFVEHPPTPEQHQFLRDIGRTPPGKGQYVRVTKYWVSGHTRGPEDAPHVHAIKVMDPDNSDRNGAVLNQN